MGSPGKSGKQGIMGPAGAKVIQDSKGQKGTQGPLACRDPKESLVNRFQLLLLLFPQQNLTVNESGTALFQCSVSGNPEPAVVWSKRGNLSEGSESAVSKGRLLLKNVKANDSGEYQCSATNILGHVQTLLRLVVNGEFI